MWAPKYTAEHKEKRVDYATNGPISDIPDYEWDHAEDTTKTKQELARAQETDRVSTAVFNDLSSVNDHKAMRLYHVRIVI